MATHSSILAWRIPWTEETGTLQFLGSQELDTTQRLNHHHHYSCGRRKEQDPATLNLSRCDKLNEIENYTSPIGRHYKSHGKGQEYVILQQKRIQLLLAKFLIQFFPDIMSRCPIQSTEKPFFPQGLQCRVCPKAKILHILWICFSVLSFTFLSPCFQTRLSYYYNESLQLINQTYCLFSRMSLASFGSLHFHKHQLISVKTCWILELVYIVCIDGQ